MAAAASEAVAQRARLDGVLQLLKEEGVGHRLWLGQYSELEHYHLQLRMLFEEVRHMVRRGRRSSPWCCSRSTCTAACCPCARHCPKWGHCPWRTNRAASAAAFQDDWILLASAEEFQLYITSTVRPFLESMAADGFNWVRSLLHDRVAGEQGIAGSESCCLHCGCGRMMGLCLLAQLCGLD